LKLGLRIFSLISMTSKNEGCIYTKREDPERGAKFEEQDRPLAVVQLDGAWQGIVDPHARTVIQETGTGAGVSLGAEVKKAPRIDGL
jgi:hypothetical protein